MDGICLVHRGRRNPYRCSESCKEEVGLTLRVLISKSKPVVHKVAKLYGLDKLFAIVAMHALKVLWKQFVE